jgi:uncharacterized protein DUF4325
MASQTDSTVSIPMITVVGIICSTHDDGLKVNRLVQSMLNQGHSVTLDFHGVKFVTPTFYSAAVGNLFSTFREDNVCFRLKVIQLP